MGEFTKQGEYWELMECEGKIAGAVREHFIYLKTVVQWGSYFGDSCNAMQKKGKMIGLQ